MLFFALVQNYAQAGSTSLLTLSQSKPKAPIRIVAVMDTEEIPITLDHEIVPSF